jgi:hypothetical protein
VAGKYFKYSKWLQIEMSVKRCFKSSNSQVLDAKRTRNVAELSKQRLVVFALFKMLDLTLK